MTKPKSTRMRPTKPHPKAWLQARATLSNAIWLLDWQLVDHVRESRLEDATNTTKALSILIDAYHSMLPQAEVTNAIQA